jgi:hypothetical protein
MTDVARPTWKDPDWFVAFTGWATDELATLGFEVTGAPEQTHVRPWSTVVRIPTDRGPFWAKAMRPSTSHEARLLPAMGGIGKRPPGRARSTGSTRPRWRGTVMSRRCG